MTFTRKLAVAAFGAGLAASGFLLTQVSSDNASSRADELTSPTSPLSSDAIAIDATARAGLVQMCLDGLHDGSAYAKYRAAAAADPTIGADVTGDCQRVVSFR